MNNYFCKLKQPPSNINLETVKAYIFAQKRKQTETGETIIKFIPFRNSTAASSSTSKSGSSTSSMNNNSNSSHSARSINLVPSSTTQKVISKLMNDDEDISSNKITQRKNNVTNMSNNNTSNNKPMDSNFSIELSVPIITNIRVQKLGLLNTLKELNLTIDQGINVLRNIKEEYQMLF